MELISVEKPYNGMEAKLGDVVYKPRGIADASTSPQKVVYVGRESFATEFSDGRLMTYRKATAEKYLAKTEQRLLVNGFEVLAPLEADPGEGRTIYVADPALPAWYFEVPQSSTANKALLIVRGLTHATAAAAITHAKAIVGVDPYAAPVFLDDAYDNLP